MTLKMKLKVLLLLINILSSPIAFAYDFKVDNIYYSIINIQDQTCMVVNNGGADDALNSYAGHVTIPETVTFNGRVFKVIKLGDMGYNPSLLSLKIGDSITEISGGACNKAINLVDLIIGHSVVSIGNGAFNGCTKLKNIIIPPNVIQLYTDVFRNCPNVESLILEEGNSHLNFWFGNGYSCPFDDSEFKNVFIGRDTYQNSFVSGAYESEIMNLMYNKKLESLTIGSNIRKFDYRLEFATNLKKITCLSQIPPSTSNTTVNRFSPSQYQNIILYVPTGSKELYKVAPLWENFWNIVESDNGVTIDNLSFRESVINLNVGDRYKILYDIFPVNASNPTLEWYTDNEGTIHVDSDGNVTALSPGSVTVYAKTTDGTNISSSCVINVTQKIESITLDATSFSLYEEDSKLLHATLHPSGDTNLIEWQSANPAVATVDKNGMVVAKSKGETTITAKYSLDNSISEVCYVKVLRHVQGVVLSQTGITLSVNSGRQIQATVYPESADNKSVLWTSDNPNVASVSPDGFVTAISCGETVIKAICDERPELYATCSVSVNSLVTSVNLNCNNATLSEGECLHLIATVLPDDASNKSIIWSSSDESVATVNQEGVVTAISKGIAIISAKASDGSNVSASCTINVKKLVSNIILNKTELTINESQSEQLFATVIPDQADNKNLIWSSSDNTIASVNGDGIVYAVSKGSTTICVKSSDESNVMAFCTVTVLKPVKSICVNPTQISMAVGEHATITAYALPLDASNPTLQWLSQDNNVVDVDDEGVVHAVGIGNTYISIESTDGSNIKQQCEISVQPNSGVDTPSFNNPNISIRENSINITHVPNKNIVSIYLANGTLVKKVISNGNDITYSPSSKGIYIVVIGTRSYKVIFN